MPRSKARAGDREIDGGGSFSTTPGVSIQICTLNSPVSAVLPPEAVLELGLVLRLIPGMSWCPMTGEREEAVLQIWSDCLEETWNRHGMGGAGEREGILPMDKGCCCPRSLVKGPGMIVSQCSLALLISGHLGWLC